jgi:hypothetical protein
MYGSEESNTEPNISHTCISKLRLTIHTIDKNELSYIQTRTAIQYRTRARKVHTSIRVTTFCINYTSFIFKDIKIIAFSNDFIDSISNINKS